MLVLTKSPSEHHILVCPPAAGLALQLTQPHSLGFPHACHFELDVLFVGGP